MAILTIIALTFLSGCGSTPAELLPFALPHLPFALAAAVLYALGQGVKRIAPTSWPTFRRTMPWHPVLAGGVFGACFPVVAPADVAAQGAVAAALYFAGSGVLATYGRDVFRTWQKYRKEG